MLNNDFIFHKIFYLLLKLIKEKTWKNRNPIMLIYIYFVCVLDQISSTCNKFLFFTLCTLCIISRHKILSQRYVFCCLKLLSMYYVWIQDLGSGSPLLPLATSTQPHTFEIVVVPVFCSQLLLSFHFFFLLR